MWRLVSGLMSISMRALGAQESRMSLLEMQPWEGGARPLAGRFGEADGMVWPSIHPDHFHTSNPVPGVAARNTTCCPGNGY